MIIEETQMDEKQFFDKARQVAKAIDRGTYMKETDEYKVCSLEEAEAFAKKRGTKEMNAYELADLMLDVTDCESSEYYQAGLMLRHQADYIKHLEDSLKASIALNKAQLERLSDLERKHKEEFDYAEKLLKERNQ
jgi:hypothetical protein